MYYSFSFLFYALSVNITTRFVYNKGDVMSYKVLSEQYFAQYKNLSVYIKKLKNQIKSTNIIPTRDEIRRVNILYIICLELKHTSEYLKKCERRETYVEK